MAKGEFSEILAVEYLLGRVVYLSRIEELYLLSPDGLK